MLVHCEFVALLQVSVVFVALIGKVTDGNR